MFNFDPLRPVLDKVIELAENLQNARKLKSAFHQSGETPIRTIGKFDFEDMPDKDILWDYLNTLDTDIINQLLTVMYGGRDAMTSVSLNGDYEIYYQEEFEKNEENYEEVYEKLMKPTKMEFDFEFDYKTYQHFDRDGSIISLTDKFHLPEMLKAGKEVYKI